MITYFDDHEVNVNDHLLKFIHNPVSPKAQSIARMEDIRRRVLAILGEVNDMIEGMKR